MRALAISRVNDTTILIIKDNGCAINRSSYDGNYNLACLFVSDRFSIIIEGKAYSVTLRFSFSLFSFYSKNMTRSVPSRRKNVRKRRSFRNREISQSLLFDSRMLRRYLTKCYICTSARDVVSYSYDLCRDSIIAEGCRCSVASLILPIRDEGQFDDKNARQTYMCECTVSRQLLQRRRPHSFVPLILSRRRSPLAMYVRTNAVRFTRNSVPHIDTHVSFRKTMQRDIYISNDRRRNAFKLIFRKMTKRRGAKGARSCIL